MTAEQERFALVPISVIKNKSLSFKELGIFTIIAAHASKEGSAIMKVETIAELAGISRGTVHTCLKKLETAGVLKRTRRKSKGHEGWQCNRYTIVRPKRPAKEAATSDNDTTANDRNSFVQETDTGCQPAAHKQDSVNKGTLPLSDSSSNSIMDFTPSPDTRDWCRLNKPWLDVEQLKEKYITWLLANRKTYSDLQQGFKYWAMQEYKPRDTAKNGGYHGVRKNKRRFGNSLPSLTDEAILANQSQVLALLNSGEMHV